MIQMQGMPAAPGCAVGQVLLFPKGPISISKQAVTNRSWKSSSLILRATLVLNS